MVAPAGRAHRAELSIAVRAALVVLRAYKIVLSPVFAGACRFTPSCSDYMARALAEHGLMVGAWLGTKRLLRCRPFGGHGYDPVPPRRG